MTTLTLTVVVALTALIVGYIADRYAAGHLARESRNC